VYLGRMKFRIRKHVASSRIREVLEAIISSNAWDRHAKAIASKDFLTVREPFRAFFDVYEGLEGEDWLGVMEWAVIEEVRLRAFELTADRPCVDSILSRMATHPNITLLDK